MREVAGDRSKPNCFELYSASSEVIKACKTDSEGKVIEGLYKICHIYVVSEYGCACIPGNTFSSWIKLGMRNV